MKVEIRNNQVTIEGYVNVTHRDSKPLQSGSGIFVEQIEPNAFGQALETNSNVDLLFNHKQDRKLGSIIDGNLTLEEDAIGLKAVATITDEEVVKEARAGNLKGWSFGFRSLADRWESVTNGIQRRFVEKMELLEISILNVTPAYNALSLQVRSEKEVEQRFYDDEINVEEIKENSEKATTKSTEKVDEIMTPEERELLQKKSELLEQRSEEADKKIKEIEEELKKINESKKSEKEVDNVEDRFSTMEYRQAFVKNLVGRANHEQREMLESANGIIIPTTIQEQVERKLLDFSPIRGLVRVISSASNMVIAIDAEGATASWVAEGGLIPETDVTLASVNISAHKLATLCKISNEFIADSVVNIESYVSEVISEAVALLEGDAFINGDGIGKPTGLLNGVTPTAGEVSYDGFVDMFMSLNSGYRANASFLVAEDVYASMLKLKDNAGRPLMQVSTDGISGAPVSSILGKRVVVEPHLGEGLVVYADFKRAYIIVDRQGMTVRTATERFIENDMTAIVVTKRTDGHRLNEDAMRVFDVVI